MSERALRFPQSEDVLRLRTLWLACFPEDDDGYCDFFLNRWFRPDRCLVIGNGTELESMVHLFTAELWNRGQFRGSYLYLYAVGTAPAHRGQGNLGKLLRGCLELAKERGMSGILLTSAEGLEPLYEHYGMQPCAVRYETHLELPPAEPLNWEACDYESYASMRRAYLSGLEAAYVWQPDSDRFIYEVQKDSGAVMQWQENGTQYYAVTGCEEDVPTLLETNHPLDLPFLARVAAALKQPALKICSPTPITGESEPICFGHRLLTTAEGSQMCDAYLNLIAD